MHEVIQHIGLALRLDCWHVTAERRFEGVQSLQDFANRKPAWEDIKLLAKDLVRTFVASGGSISQERRKAPECRDEEFKNSILKQQYFLHYEEITYAMNEGDIGRVENCFLTWIFIFKSTGKNKYAAQMAQSLYDLHFNYPDGLRYVSYIYIIVWFFQAKIEKLSE